MKRLALAVVICCLAGVALGVFFAAAVGGAPASWLEVQSRPPRLVALVALGPILLVAVAAVVARFVRRKRKAKLVPGAVPAEGRNAA